MSWLGRDAVILEAAEIWERQNTLRYQLIVTELELALTFFRIAANTKDQDRAQRNFHNACRAVSSAQHLLTQVSLTPSMLFEIRDRLRPLRPFFKGSAGSFVFDL